MIVINTKLQTKNIIRHKNTTIPNKKKMASSSSPIEFDDISYKIKRAILQQRQDDRDILLGLHKTFDDFSTGRTKRKEAMKKIADLGNTITGMAGVLFLQHIGKQDEELMQMIMDVYNEVEEGMVTKMEYVLKSD
jgi:hypothetical protein